MVDSLNRWHNTPKITIMKMNRPIVDVHVRYNSDFSQRTNHDTGQSGLILDI